MWELRMPESLVIFLTSNHCYFWKNEKLRIYKLKDFMIKHSSTCTEAHQTIIAVVKGTKCRMWTLTVLFLKVSQICRLSLICIKFLVSFFFYEEANVYSSTLWMTGVICREFTVETSKKNRIYYCHYQCCSLACWNLIYYFTISGYLT